MKLTLVRLQYLFRYRIIRPERGPDIPFSPGNLHIDIAQLRGFQCQPDSFFIVLKGPNNLFTNLFIDGGCSALE